MIKADEYNSIIEPYFDGGDSYTGHHKFSYIMQYQCSGDTSVSQTWACGCIEILKNGKGTISREIFPNDISGYDTVTLKASFPEGVKVTLWFDDVQVLSTEGTGFIDIFEAPIKKSGVSKITLDFNSVLQYNVCVNLYYIGVSKRAVKQEPLYVGNWEGCFEENVSFELYDEDFISREVFENLPAIIQEYKEVYETEKKTALQALENEPEQYISKVHGNGFRKGSPFTLGRMVSLAFIGMCDKNAEMIKMACRYALSAAACTYWCSDIMEEIPTCVWHHRSFDEMDLCKDISIVISICGNSLTWHGRNVLYQALIMKGLPRIEADFMTMDYIYKMNQGLAFMSGYASALVCLSHIYPRYENRIDEAQKLMREMLENAKNPDGSTDEGAGYWQYTFWSAIRGIEALRKHKCDGDFEEYIRESLKKTSDFGLFLLDSSGKTIPYNDSGEGYYMSYLCKFFYLVTKDRCWAAVYNNSDKTKIGLDNIMLNVAIPQDAEFTVKEFESFDDVGLMAVNRDGIRIFCVSGKSNSTHCHADRGSFIIYNKDKMLLADRGSLAYGSSGDIHSSEVHNTAVPIYDGMALSQKTGDGYCADFKYEYNNGVLNWTSDQTSLWDKDLVLKNTRNIYSDKPNEFIITDEFEFTEPVSVGVNFHTTDEASQEIIPLSEYEDVQYSSDNLSSGGETVYRTCFVTKPAKTVEFTTKIIIKKE